MRLLESSCVGPVDGPGQQLAKATNIINHGSDTGADDAGDAVAQDVATSNPSGMTKTSSARPPTADNPHRRPDHRNWAMTPD